MSQPILRLCSRSAWEEAQKTGAYRHPSLETEGFIHCSTPDQVLDVARKHYAGQSDLVVLVIDPALVTSPVKFEPAKNGLLYPHIYGPLNLDAIQNVFPFPLGEGGTFQLPDTLALGYDVDM